MGGAAARIAEKQSSGYDVAVGLLVDLQEMCDPTLKLVPQDGPKKVGDSWKREGTVNLGPIGTYKLTYDFKYVGAPVPNPGVWMRKELEC